MAFGTKTKDEPKVHHHDEQLAKSAEQAVALNVKPGAVVGYDYSEETVSGFEGADKADFIVPILDILQSGSPEVKESTVEGAKSGSLYIRALGALFDGAKGVPFIPCGREHVMNEWKTRDGGSQGGFVAAHDPNHPDMKAAKLKQPFGKIKIGDNELVETFNLFGFALTPDHDIIRCFVPFWSTKITRYRSLMTKADGLTIVSPKTGARVKMPLFAHYYLLKTLFVKKGNFSWHGYSDIGWLNKTAVEFRVDPSSPLYAEARDFARQISEGKVKADTSSAVVDDAETASQGSGGGTGGHGGATGGVDENGQPIPF